MEDYKQYEIREGIVFLIEVSEAILAQDNEPCQLYAILECINDLMSDMVVPFPSNGVGIYLYGCEDTGAKFAKNSGINKIFSLNDLNSSNMKTLINILHDHDDGFKPLSQRFAPAKTSRDNLHTALKVVLRQYQTKPHYNYKKLLWFTNNDKPYVNPELKDSLRTMISDFEDNNILINPYFLETFTDEGKKAFDASLYENIFLNTNFLKHAQRRERNVLARSEGTRSYKWQQTLVIDEVKKGISRLKEVRRTQFACDLILSDGPVSGGQLGCSVKGYSLYNHEAVKPFKQLYTEGDQLKIVHNDSKTVRADNEAVIENEKTIKGVPVKANSEGGEKILLLSEDVLEFMKGSVFDHDCTSLARDDLDLEGDDRPKVEISQAPYLKLVCFRDVRTLQPYMNVNPPLFVTADSTNGINTSKQGGFTHSFRTFRSLYQSCVKLRRYAVLFGCNKRNTSPDLYALYPTNLEVTGDPKSPRDPKTKKVPDGFLLINIPWMNEIRSLPDHMMLEKYFFPEKKDAAPPELVSVFVKLIEQFQPWKSYEPRQLPNPVIKYFYEVIKNEALQMDVKDEDHSVEGNDWSAQSLIELREHLEKSTDSRGLFWFVNDILNKMGNADVMKRAAEERPSNKRQKAALTESDVIALWKHNTWSNVTLSQLKDFAARYDAIKSASRKPDLVENIVEFLESRRK